MINCHPHNKTITNDMRIAIYQQDSAFFIREIKRLSAMINARESFSPCEYDPELSRLLVCLSMHDNLIHHGDTVKLICDLVNF